MTAAEFDVLMEYRISAIRRVLAAKAGEYATGGDHLHNFKAAAVLGDDTPGEALLGMLRKHWVSVMDLVDQHAIGVRHGHDRIDEKVGDAINYLVLLEAILKES